MSLNFYYLNLYPAWAHTYVQFFKAVILWNYDCSEIDFDLQNLHVRKNVLTTCRSTQAIPNLAPLNTDLDLLLHDYDNMVRVYIL